MPDFVLEQEHSGIIVGLDEVGRGPMAGPVVAACVYIPADKYGMDVWTIVNDSKKFSAKRREELAEIIKVEAQWGIGEACPIEISEHNILQATFLAMRRAYDACGIAAEMALIDGNHKPKSFPCPATPVIKGDAKSVSIAAASILAKVHRDNIMSDLAKTYPHYGWESNSGYPSPAHKKAVNEHGITPHHRQSYAPIKNFLEFGHTDGEVKKIA